MTRIEIDVTEIGKEIGIATRKVNHKNTEKEDNVADMIHKLVNMTCKSIVEEVGNGKETDSIES